MDGLQRKREREGGGGGGGGGEEEREKERKGERKTCYTNFFLTQESFNAV